MKTGKNFKGMSDDLNKGKYWNNNLPQTHVLTPLFFR